MKLLYISLITGLGVLILLLISRPQIEPFNDLQSRIALYEHPGQCPFDYVKLYEDTAHNNKFVVESKVKQQPPNLDQIFKSIDDYQTAWNQVKTVFPNLTQCPDPYQKYLDQMRQYYAQQKYQLATRQTTTPLYQQGGSGSGNGNEVQQLPTIQDNRNLTVRELTRTVTNPSQLTSDLYMKPNTPNTRGNEQIDTSVQPADHWVPITNSAHNLRLLQNQMEDESFERQRAAQKQIYQMQAEITHLQMEIERLRSQLVDQKSYFEDLDQTVETKHKQIVTANRVNQQLTKNIQELEKKATDLENLYLQADSQRNSLAVRLKTLRTSVEEEIKNQGYTYVPPTHWTMNQWRPPQCLPESKQSPCPITIGQHSSDYAKVFDETAVKNTSLYIPQETSLDPIDYISASTSK
uniref:Uncharacterized protein n=1 Tax=viral metagenome TaxID=1070528 RepID=A0A6C0BJA1_9ZZZZ